MVARGKVKGVAGVGWNWSRHITSDVRCAHRIILVPLRNHPSQIVPFYWVIEVPSVMFVNGQRNWPVFMSHNWMLRSFHQHAKPGFF
ncbi:hypothetical protein BaRGS_00022508 [Batillaria attramentaria]|uniref:Uncharacterized protein n=1 Tax=Batillaria attramentaria TaxID=370345 RepID=A0ABD0KGS4_9CAEN